MKFGGSSLASPSTIRRVAEIVTSQPDKQKFLVVSAHGETTNRLVEILKHAAHAETYLSWKAIKELREYHFALAEEMLSDKALEPVDHFLREIFRDLHVRMLEVCDGERTLTGQDRAWTLSLGEQISSRLMAAILSDAGLPAQHLDARLLILTDDDCCQAQPRYWESYARIRRAAAAFPGQQLFVTGGFISASEDGCTTVLGRGGSDLTATIMGAGLNADEIQIWKDVDGILTCDPRLKHDALLVKNLSYKEAATLAQAGAKILHPDTIAPAERLRIPVILRNTFQPESEGTRIGASSCVTPGVKSIACRSRLLLLDISAGQEKSGAPQLSALASELKEQGAGVQILSCSAERLLLVADDRTDFSGWKMIKSGCLQVHVKGTRMLLTLVGDQLAGASQAVALALGQTVLLVEGETCLYVVIDECDSEKCLNLLHQALFQAGNAVFTKTIAVVLQAAGLRAKTKGLELAPLMTALPEFTAR